MIIGIIDVDKAILIIDLHISDRHLNPNKLENQLITYPGMNKTIKNRKNEIILERISASIWLLNISIMILAP